MKIETIQHFNGEWSAIDADNYDVESDSVGAWSSSPRGYGKTEQEAVLDLFIEITYRSAVRRAAIAPEQEK